MSNSEAPTWDAFVELAKADLDFLQTNTLDGLLARAHPDGPGANGAAVRLAVLGSSTLAHLHGGLRVAALRRGLWLQTYENDYGQYRQELLDRDGPLRAFEPTAILFAFDPWHVTAGVHPGLSDGETAAALERSVGDIVATWRLAREGFGVPVLQQTVMPVFGDLLGSNEHRLPGSRADFVRRLNEELRRAADAEGVHLVALDRRATLDGLGAWHDVALWRRSKQEVRPTAAPMYGELVVRVLAAIQGRSYKCLVLDLDNTLWGGVVGDDGVDGLVLGQGSAVGEAFSAIQEYARDLSRRGVILAVCSKNDEANAFEAFDRHPEMVLKRSDVACFMANWQDKATNLRRIASELNIGIDSLVFLDDNPAERGLIRAELPMVAVPEVGDEPALYPTIVADAGYFESVGVTREDRARGDQYQANRLREAGKETATDMASYLRGLDMELLWRPFDAAGLPRVTQLINKTNQFNLTTQRRTEEEVETVMADEASLGLQFRLTDRFGDNGVIAVVIGQLHEGDLSLDTWLMSCRVLGREVEQATLDVVAEEARRMGARRLIGLFKPSPKNAMVRDHYVKLGFQETSPPSPDGAATYLLDLAPYQERGTPITLKRG